MQGRFVLTHPFATVGVPPPLVALLLSLVLAVVATDSNVRRDSADVLGTNTMTTAPAYVCLLTLQSRVHIILVHILYIRRERVYETVYIHLHTNTVYKVT